MPADTNSKGEIFGGWLMSQMDLGAAVFAGGIAHGRVTTAAVDGLAFLRPVKVGDVVSCYAQLLGIGRSSMKIRVEVWVRRHADTSPLQVAEGTFVYVAIDETGKPQPVKRSATPATAG